LSPVLEASRLLGVDVRVERDDRVLGVLESHRVARVLEHHRAIGGAVQVDEGGNLLRALHDPGVLRVVDAVVDDQRPRRNERSPGPS
jgi:hypothetical protein